MVHPSSKNRSPNENPFARFGETYRLSGMSDPRRKPLPPLPLPIAGPVSLRIVQPLSPSPALPPSPRPIRGRTRPNPLKALARAGQIFLLLLVIAISFLPEPAWRKLHTLWPGGAKPVSTVPLLPVRYDYVSSPFGLRWGRMHQGIDLAAKAGTPVYAMASGKVLYSGWEAGYGRSVVLDHGNGVKTRYAHCLSLLTSAGKRVARGSVIAKVGSTGHSTGPHLHFEVLVKGVRRNPEWYYVFPSKKIEMASSLGGDE